MVVQGLVQQNLKTRIQALLVPHTSKDPLKAGHLNKLWFENFCFLLNIVSEVLNPILLQWSS